MRQGADQESLVAVLGAAGAVGAALSGDLAGDETVRLRLVDADPRAVEHLASDRVQVVRADLLDPRAAEDACRDSSLLMNCMSMTFFDDIFELALKHGIDYADLVSEPSDAQVRQAKAAGIVAVPGLGISPGLSNVLVRHAAQEMEVTAAEILFAIFRPAAQSRGALDTLIWEIAEYCPERVIFEDGELVAVGPFDRRRRVDFGGDFGELEVLVRPHPEPKSLPKNFPSLRFVAVRGTWQPELVADFEVLNRYGLLADEVSCAQTKEAIWRRIGGQGSDKYIGQSAAKVEVRGTRDGTVIGRTYEIITPQDIGAYPLTGICAAVGVRLMLRRDSGQTGVGEPEVFFDPAEYLDGLEKQGVIGVTWSDGAPASGVLDPVG